MNQALKPVSILKVYLVIALLMLLGIFVLSSLAPFVFPNYFFLIGAALVSFFVFQRIDFKTLSYFSPLFYVVSILLLISTLVLGQITRGTSRWIEVGGFQAQPAEIVRAFLILFIAYLCNKYQNNLTSKLLICGAAILVPTILIFIQPSLGVSLVTVISLLAVIVVSGIPSRILVGISIILLVLAPISLTLLAPYQKARLEAVLGGGDSQGAGYQSAQAVIAAGAGQIFGRGLGSGVQTQLSFLPERHTDFIFASITEELGLIGAVFTLALVFLLPYFLIVLSLKPGDSIARLYLVGASVSLFVQSAIHVGMNIGLLPITGLPLPLVSYGGSSLMGTLIICALSLQAIRRLGTIHSSL